MSEDPKETNTDDTLLQPSSAKKNIYSITWVVSPETNEPPKGQYNKTNDFLFATTTKKNNFLTTLKRDEKEICCVLWENFTQHKF